MLQGDRAEAGLRIKATCSSFPKSLRFQELKSLGFRLHSTSQLLSDFRGHIYPLGSVCPVESLREQEDHVIRGPSQLQPPERRFFYGWFSAQELASLSGNLPASHPQLLFSLIVVSQSKTAFATCCRGRLCLPPSLPSWYFSLGGGGALGKRDRSLQLPGLLPAASLLFLSPFPPPSPHPDRNSASHFLGMLRSQPEPAV